MAISYYTGSFRFSPPKPFLIGVLTQTGHAKDIIRITGQNLDYVNTVFLENDICQFQKISQNSLSFTVPDNPNTGFIEITNQTFFPLRGPDVIFATGIEPKFKIELGQNQKYINLSNVYQQNIYSKDSIYLYKIKNTGVNNFVVELSKNPFRNEAVNFISTLYTGQINSGQFQVYQTGINNGQFNYFIPLLQNISDPYISIIDQINTGDGFYGNFVSGFSPNGFYLNFTDYLNEDITLNIGVYKTGLCIFNSGYHFANYYDITGSGTYFGIKYPGNIQLDKDVQILTNIAVNSNNSNKNFYVSKIYEINETGFYFGLSKNIVNNDSIKVQYLVLKNSGEYLQSIYNKFLASNESFISDNKSPFYPVSDVNSVDPIIGSSGDVINLKGISFNFITGIQVATVPLFDDIEYIFAVGSNNFNSQNLSLIVPGAAATTNVIPTPTFIINTIGNRTVKQMLNSNDFVVQTSLNPLNCDISLNQIVNKDKENSYFNIVDLRPFDYVSGKPIFLRGTGLDQTFYENHTFTFKSISGDNNLQSFTTGLFSGYNSYFINLPSGFKPTGISSGGYSPFYSLAFTGKEKDYYSYISGKSSSGFYINFNKNLNYDLSLNCLLINNISSGFYFDKATYNSSGIQMPSIETETKINFTNDYLFNPFILTSIEYSGGLNTTGYRYSINNLQKNSFKTFLPYRTGDSIKINYCTIINPDANLSTFEYNGASSFYKKTYLFTGSLDSIYEYVNVNNINKRNKNNLSFELPYTENYINGPIKIKGLFDNNNETNLKIVETPKITGLEPESIVTGQPFKVLGKSFKKPILLDGTGYNSTNINLKYSDNIYLENDNNLRINAFILDVNTISGIIPAVDNPPGNYAVQVITEKGDLF
jgi:hypothetical protein